MNQMEHNVKIKTYGGIEGGPQRPYLHYDRILNNNTQPAAMEQTKMVERLKNVHWNADQIHCTSTGESYSFFCLN